MFSLHFFRVIDFFSSLNCVIYVMQGLLIISPEKFGHAKWDFCQLYCASQKYMSLCVIFTILVSFSQDKCTVCLKG